MRWMIFTCSLFLLASCGTAEENGNTAANIDDFTVSTPTAETAEDDFIYRLVAETETFTAGGPVNIYAELEYTGEQDTIGIFHAASPFHFPMHEKTRDYAVDYFMEEPLIQTTLVKGQPYREKYGPAGGYSQEDAQEYKDFIDNIVDGHFPEGYYVMDGVADFYTEEPVQTDYNIKAQIDFKVVP